MKKRIISAAILVPILFLLTLAAPVIAASLVMSALMAIAAYELLYRTGLVKRPRLVIYSCIMAAAVCMWSYFGAIHSYFVILMIVFFILMFSEMMLDHIKVHFEDLSMCFVAGTAKAMPPSAPSMVLLGLTTGASLCRPNFRPIKYAPASDINATTKGIRMTYRPRSIFRMRMRELSM